MFRYFLLALAVGVALGAGVDDCPTVLPRTDDLQAFGSSCYRFVHNKLKTWEAAEDDCEEDNGRLVIIKSEDIDNFVLNMTKSYGKPVWIGLHDMHEEDEFLWADGTLYDLNGYSHFGENEGPRKSFIQSHWEDCVAIDPADGFWKDFHCRNVLSFYDAKKAYMCQYAMTK